MSKMKTFSAFAAASALTVLMGTAAGAATLSFIGVGTTLELSGNDVGFNGETIDYITGAQKSVNNGLSVSGPAKLTFTYLGYEASHTNYAANIDGNLFENATATVGDTVVTTQTVGGLIDFSFGTSAPSGAIGQIWNNGEAIPEDQNYAIGYLQESATSWVVLFDDRADGDRDFDDIAMRITVAPIPLPAAGWLLLGGIGALGLARRRRKVA